jgi:hypothetical protein
MIQLHAGTSHSEWGYSLRAECGEALVQRVVYFQSTAMPTKSSIHASERVKQALELNETVH